ncbi:MAG: toll/interleukin-1 receptor domain-containing protein [Nitrosopumilus sp.]|nr:toll/interleukin-1 receptor domain-containing protein [Nitrosopumilus sp.]
MPSGEPDGVVTTAFISYAGRDIAFAEMARDYLGICGVDAFFADDDIRAGRDWRKNLIDEIKNREYFVLLLSQLYHRGRFTDQEFGMAVAHDRKIIIVVMDHTEPYGFMKHYQHINMREWKDEVYKACAGLSKAAGEITGRAGGLGVDFNIQALGKSRYYAEANYNARIILESREAKNGGITGTQINSIAGHYLENDQIHGARSRWTVDLLRFLLAHPDHIGKERYAELAGPRL